MDILRLLVKLPFILIRMALNILFFVFKFLFLILKPVLGNLNWQAPAWYTAIKNGFLKLEKKAAQHAIIILSIILFIVISVFVARYIYIYEQNKPKPIPPAEIITQKVSFSLQKPDYPDQLNPKNKQTLSLNFSKSAAPIEKIEKLVEQGVSISPAIKGAWKWQNESTLTFTADEQFILGQEYNITFQPTALLAPNVVLDSASEPSIKFTAPTFYAEIVNGTLSSSPNSPRERQAFFTIKFPVPVDKKSFESAIQLSKTRFLGESKEETSTIPFTVKYDEKNPLLAYVQSGSLILDEYPSQLTLLINETIKGQTYSLSAKSGVKKTIELPDQFGLKIQSIETDIVEQQNKEQRLLIINVNDPIKSKALKSAMKVWLLPERNDGYEWSVDNITDSDLTQQVSLTSVVTEDQVTEDQVTEDEVNDNASNHSDEADNTELMSSSIQFLFDAPENRTLYVTIDKQDILSKTGYKFKKPIQQLLSVRPFTPKLNFTSNGAILPLKGSKTLDISERNLNGMQVELYRIRPNQLQHMIWQKDDNYSYWNDYDYSETALHFSDYFTQFVNFDPTLQGKTQHYPVDLSQFLSNQTQFPRGIFLIKLRSWGGKNKTIQPPLARRFNDQDWVDSDWYQQSNQHKEGISKGDVFDQRIIVVTDIGIITKRDIDQTWHVFAQSISQNKPLAHSKISVIAKNGSELLSAISDENGHVHFPSLANFTGEQEPSYFLVENVSNENSLAENVLAENQTNLGVSDFSFLPVFYSYDRMIDFSRFDTGGNQQPRDPKSLSSYLFSDRGVYRPGDTFNIGIITRTTDWSNQLAGIPLLAIIYDARYQEVKRQTIVLDQSGFNELSYTTAENSPTGEWRVELYLPGKHTDQTAIERDSDQNNDHSLNDALLLGDVTVNIKEFEPDRLKVNVALTPKVPNEGWINPSELKARVNVNTLFDTPAENRRVTAELTLKPVYPHFKRYDDYQFYENAPNRDGISEQLEEVTTDLDGNADIKMNLNSYEAGSYQLNLLVEAFEAGAGRSVAGTARTLISPYDYLIGFKQSDDLSFINQHAERNVHLIAINPELEKVAVTDLSVERVERKYISVLVQQASGAYQYESKLKETVIATTPLSISATGNDLVLDTQTPGDYVLVIKNKANQVLNRIYYSVAGNADVSRDLDRAAELNVKLDKAVYEPGGKMAISINAPYTGSGLITIERDKVYSWHWFHTDTTNSVQEITLPDMQNFEGNAYVTVQFVRDSNSPEIFMSPLSYAAVPFQLSHAARTAELSVSAPKLLKSGETLSMTVKTNSPQQVVLFAVDEGILQVARYKLNDPLDYFFQKRALEVRSAQILDLILPEYTQLQQFIAAAGGDGSEGLDLHLNPFKRKKDKPVVFWSGIQTIDGEKTFDYSLPSYFSGKVRIMAISVTPDKIGHAQTESVIRDEVVLSPNAPTTVAPDDEFEVSVGVTNNLDSTQSTAQTLRLTLETTPELALLSDKQQTITLEPNREGFVTYRLKANQQLGGAELNFKVEYLNNEGKPLSQTRSVGISVRPLVPHRTEIQMGRMRGKQQSVTDLRTLYPNFAMNQAKASYSPLLLSSGLAAFLNDYQHLCSEQIVSRAIPFAVQRNYPEFAANQDLAHINSDIKTMLALLQNRQNSRGAIGLWQVEQYPDPFITAHAVMFMLEAKSANITIPESLLNNANRYLRELSQDQDSYDIKDLRLRAYAAYLLAKQGEVVTSQVADIESRLIKIDGEESTDLTALYLAATYQLLKLDKKAQQWLQPSIKELEKAYTESWWNMDYWDPLVIDATRLAIIGELFPQQLSKLPPQVLDNLQQMLSEQRFTTLSSAMTVIALDRYSKAANLLAENSNTQQLTISRQFVDNNTGNNSTGNNNQNQQLEQISTLRGMLVSGQFPSSNNSQSQTQAVVFNNSADLPAWYSVTQSGFDYALANQPIRDGLEVTRFYTDLQDKPITEVKLGETINVHVKVRANSKEGQNAIALIDLLPGGFEVVQQDQHLVPEGNNQDSENGDIDESENSDNTESEHVRWKSPIAVNGSWSPDYTDVREDRVLIYGQAQENVQEFVYQIKATNIGRYQVPPAYAEAMYNRRVQAVSAVENKWLTVVKP